MAQLVCAGVGLWLIVTGAVPAFLFGRANQPIPKRGARTIGFNTLFNCALELPGQIAIPVSACRLSIHV